MVTAVPTCCQIYAMKTILLPGYRIKLIPYARHRVNTLATICRQVDARATTFCSVELDEWGPKCARNSWTDPRLVTFLIALYCVTGPITETGIPDNLVTTNYLLTYDLAEWGYSLPIYIRFHSVETFDCRRQLGHNGGISKQFTAISLVFTLIVLRFARWHRDDICVWFSQILQSNQSNSPRPGRCQDQRKRRISLCTTNVSI
jgi:hypothetical protein